MKCKYVGSILHAIEGTNDYIVICSYDKHRPFKEPFKHTHLIEVPRHIPKEQNRRYVERVFKGSKISLITLIWDKLKYIWRTEND